MISASFQLFHWYFVAARGSKSPQSTKCFSVKLPVPQLLLPVPPMPSSCCMGGGGVSFYKSQPFSLIPLFSPSACMSCTFPSLLSQSLHPSFLLPPSFPPAIHTITPPPLTQCLFIYYYFFFENGWTLLCGAIFCFGGTSETTWIFMTNPLCTLHSLSPPPGPAM